MARVPVKLAYELIEPKDDTSDKLSPVIFLHALSLSKEENWKDITHAIANLTRRKIYRLDARNHGDSVWNDEFDFELNAIDLLHFIEDMKLKKVVIVGHCMGGITGMLAAFKQPEKIEKLFVEDIFLNKTSEIVFEAIINHFILWKEVEDLIPPNLEKQEANNFILKYTLRKLNPHYNPENNREIVIDVSYPLKRDSSGHYAFKTNLEVLCKLENVDYMQSENGKTYEGPSYFFIATESHFQVHKQKENILKFFPNAVILTFEKTSHFIHDERKEEFIETIVKYLQLNE